MGALPVFLIAGRALGVDGGAAVHAGASVALAIGLQNTPEGLIS